MIINIPEGADSVQFIVDIPAHETEKIVPLIDHLSGANIDFAIHIGDNLMEKPIHKIVERRMTDNNKEKENNFNKILDACNFEK